LPVAPPSGSAQPQVEITVSSGGEAGPASGHRPPTLGKHPAAVPSDAAAAAPAAPVKISRLVTPFCRAMIASPVLEIRHRDP
jgi:hypothetical protein